jgi:RNA polymerase sigma-70 factor (ECF subfamily)
MNLVDTGHLILRCREGDTRAIEQLIAGHYATVYRLALAILDDSAEADDAAQEVFIAALGALDSYRGESALSTWLYAITVNKCRDRLKKSQSRRRLERVLHSIFPAWHDPAGPSAESAALQNERDEAVRRAVNSLGEKQRLPVILRYYHGLSISEIANVLDINEGTIHSRLSIARERLHILLWDDLQGGP